MDAPFTPLLTTTDWNEEWQALQKARAHPDDPAEWDARSATFGTKHGSHGDYSTRFIELARLELGEKILDMGCGTGTLALPLAQMGFDVVAADFSQGMLDVLAREQEALGLDNITRIKMSWEDDWTSCGVAPKSVDVALASRSIMTANLKDSLLKLNDVARRRVCLTLSCGPSPRMDERLLEAAGLKGRLGRDFLYAFNILAGLGISPEVAYIPSLRYETFDSLDEALEAYTRIVQRSAHGFATDEELARVEECLAPWLRENLVENDRAGVPYGNGEVEKRLRLKETRRVTWAFIAWDIA